MALEKIMIGIKEGTNNDWADTVDGYLQIEYDTAMIRQEIDARVKTLPNEVDDYEGIDYLNVIFAQTPILTKAQAIITAIKTVNAVKDVVFSSYEYTDKQAGTLKMSFVIDSVLGQLNYDMFLDESTGTITTNFV